jgi:hypothetical protein
MSAEEKVDDRFEVSCICCGVRIRRDRLHDSQGLCLSCFYRILTERFRAQKKMRLGAMTSDR